MKMTRFATQRNARALLVLTILQREIKEIPLKVFRVIAKKTTRPDFFIVFTLTDHRKDAIKCSNMALEF